jgi:hypothetical protein
VLCTDTIYLFRDPRDLFISSRLFCRKDPAFLPSEVAESDCRLACHVAFQFANIHANSVADTGREDAIVLRYEDMIGDKVAIWSRLRERFDLVFKEDQDLERHLTANTVAKSVGRWQTESLPGSVTGLLTHAVGREMVQLGYEPSEGSESLQLDFSEASTPPSAISGHGGIQFDAGLAHVTVEGCDFWFIPSIEAFDAESVTNIWVCVSGGVGNHCSVYWRGPGQDFSEERSFHVAYIPAQAWRVLDFAVQDHGLWQGRIEEIRLDIFNFSSPDCRGEGLIKWMRLLRFR